MIEAEAGRGGAGGGFRFLRENERLLAISTSTVLVMAGQGVIGPVLPLFAKEFGVGAAVIGLTLSVFALSRLILNVPLSLLSDRYGRRILLVGGPLVTAADMFGSGFAGSIEELLAWRFVAGAGDGGPLDDRTWRDMVRSRDFGAVSLVTMAIFLTRTASRQTLVPLLAAARLGMSPGVLGGIFTGMSLINMLLIAPASFAADRLGRKVVIVPSLLVTAVGLLLCAGADTYTLFIVASAVTAAGAAVAGPAPAAYAADIAPPGARGLAMGLYRTTGDFGFVIGPPLLGALADRTSFGWGLAANAALLALASLAFLVFARETVGRSRRPAVPAAAVAGPLAVPAAAPPVVAESNGATPATVLASRVRRDYMRGGAIVGRDYTRETGARRNR